MELQLEFFIFVGVVKFFVRHLLLVNMLFKSHCKQCLPKKVNEVNVAESLVIIAA